MKPIQGECEPGFGRVADVFRAGIERGRDVGASIGVYHRGKQVVNLWGGMADPEQRRPWSAHTVTPLASTTKSLATTAILRLVDRGVIDLDAPVAQYWPEFGARGKEQIPVRWVLSHRSGVAALDTPVSNDDASALTPVLERIERQRPWWEPGRRHGYHAVTFGFILSGIALKVTGMSIGRLFAQDVAQPLDLDLYLGAEPGIHERVAPMIGPSTAQAI